MIKPGEYIQLLDFFRSGNNIITYYSNNENLQFIETCKRFDEVRLLHLKYKKECDNYSLYPHLDLTKLNAWNKAIENVCKQFKIKVIFKESKTTEYKKGLHAFYYYKEYNITDLIVFFKNRNKSSTSH